MKKQKRKYHTVVTVLIPMKKLWNEAKSSHTNTQIYDGPLPWLDTSTSLKRCRAKLVLWDQISPHSLMMRWCKCYSNVSKMPSLTYNPGKDIIYLKLFGFPIFWLIVHLRNLIILENALRSTSFFIVFYFNDVICTSRIIQWKYNHACTA